MAKHILSFTFKGGKCYFPCGLTSQRSTRLFRDTEFHTDEWCIPSRWRLLQDKLSGDKEGRGKQAFLLFLGTL